VSVFYRLAYRLGITPWEEATQHAPTADQVTALFDREQAGREPPYGSALDIGCGGGLWSIELARRGWDVTGVDIVPKAIATARERAREAGVEVRFIEGDVTTLRAAGVGSGFRLLWDFGTVHGLTPAQREAVGREVSAVAAPDATLLMLAWEPGRRGPMPRGASRADIEAAYAGWKVTDERALDVSSAPVPRPVRNARPRFYRLRREGAA
jgi:SAM-dependent methyltransferase